MKLTGDKIFIESRNDIDVLQNMIDTYLNSQKQKQFIDDTPVEELEKLKDELDTLWYSW